MKRNIKTSGVFPKFALRTLLLLLAIMSSTFTFAHDFEVNGIYYGYKYGSDIEVYVTSRDYDYNTYSGDVIIPETVSYGGKTYTVTEIGYMAFGGCNELLSITIPNTVNEIRSQAFSYCTGLRNIVIPNSVTLIEQAAFRDCTGLLEISFGTSLTTIEPQAFQGCSSITEVRIPNSVTRIGGFAFEGCKGIKNLYISESVSQIEDAAFAGCGALQSIFVDSNNLFYDSRNNCNAIIEIKTNKLITGCEKTSIPNTVDSIGNMAFCECTTMTEVSIPNSVKSIGSAAFYGCEALTKVIISDLEAWLNISFFDDGSNPLYCAHHLFLNGSEITNLAIPNTITSVKQCAFTGCSGLESITIPNSVKSIGFNAFAYCTGLSSIELPSSVKTIGDQAFFYCSNLSSISVPETLENIGSYAFNGTLWYNSQLDGLVYLGKIAYKYKGSMPSGTSIRLQDGTLGIAGQAFSNCSGLIDIYIPEGLISIGNAAFNRCQSLTSIVLPASVSHIGDVAFAGSGITEIIIPDAVTEIPYATFSDCQKLAHVVIGESVQLIGTSAFLYCNKLTDITLPKSVKKIDSQAFYGCSTLSSINIGDSISFIGTYAFYGCDALSIVNISNLAAWCDIEFEYGENPLSYSHSLYLNNQEIKDLIIPNSVTTIKDAAFKDCTSLTSLTIPNSTISIGENAFYNCSGLNSIDLGDSIQTIGTSAFSYCSNIESIELPSSISILERGVFSNCSMLKDVLIPNSVTSISLTTVQNQYARGTFYGCSSLESIIIPESVTSIGLSAFSGCNSLTGVTCLASIPPTITQSTFNNEIYNNAILLVRKPSVPSYTSANYWNNFSNIVALPEINIVSIPDTATLHGNTIVIPVSLENESELTAFQTDLYLPVGFELVKEDGDYLVELSDRKGRDHVIMANDLDDGGIRIISYSSTVKPYSGNEGELFYITVKTPDDGDGDYTIMLKNTLLTTTDHEELNNPDISCTVTVYPYIMGDANNSGTVTVTDIVVTARYILNYHPDPFVFGAADVNYDGNISVTDIVIIAQMIMDGAPVSYPRRAPARDGHLVRMSGQVMNDDGLHRTVSINLDNAADYTAFQLDLQLPAGMTADNFTLTDGSGFHTLDVNVLDNGKTRLLCYTPSLKALNGDEETLLTFDVTADAGAYRDIVVDGIEVVTAECQTATLDAFTIKMDNLTSVDELASGDTIAKVEYYNLSGQQIEQPSNGVTIVVKTFTNGTRSISKVVR